MTKIRKVLTEDVPIMDKIEFLEEFMNDLEDSVDNILFRAAESKQMLRTAEWKEFERTMNKAIADFWKPLEDLEKKWNKK
jgi:hypothetical protein